MGNGIATSVVMSVFLLATSVIFLFLISSYTDRSVDYTLVSNRHVSRVKSGIEFNSTAQTNGGLCDDFTAQIENTGEIMVEDFAETDLIVEYTDTGSQAVIDRLTLTTDWSVTGISPDTRDPSVWNPGEVATISFTLSPTALDATSGLVMLSTPLGITDSAYFSCVIS